MAEKTAPDGRSLRNMNTPPPEKKPLGTRILDSMPAFFSTNLRSKRSRKIWIRCWVAAWASFVLMLPQRSLKAMGNAAFFGIMTTLLVPPNAPLQMYLFGITLMVVGECIGWSLGCIAMKIGLRVRDQNILRESLLQAAQAEANSANPDAVFKVELFQGKFLDTRTSVIFGVFMALGAAFFSFVRARQPKLFFFSTFGMIFLDAFCTYGPLFPIADYTVVDTIVISASCSMAIGLACCILIFPETMNHWYLETVCSLLEGIKGYSVLQGKILDYSPDDLTVNKDGVVAKSAAVRSKLLMGMQALAPMSDLINAEFSFGRWNGDDAKSLEGPLKILVTRMSGFDSFPRLMTQYQRSRANEVFHSTAGAVTAITLVDHKTAAANINGIEEIAGDTELIRQLVSRRRDLEEKYQVRCEDVFVNLRESTIELRDALTKSIGVVHEAINMVNTCRWRDSKNNARFAQCSMDLDNAVDYLRTCMEDYKHDRRYIMLQPFIPLLQAVDDASREGDELDAEAERRGLPLRSLIIGCVYAAHLVVSSDAILDLLETVRERYDKRRKARLWAPNKLRHLAHWLMKKDKNDTHDLGEDSPPDDESEDAKQAAPYRLDPDSRPPVTIFQKAMDGLHRIYKWFRSAEGTFVVKYTTMSVLLWLPSVLTDSAEFYYKQKGLWALVMAQTTCYIYVSDQVWNYIFRLAATFLGLVVSLIAWYTGCGHGNGNAYGLAASFGVILVPISFVRAFTTPAMRVPVLMFSATLSLAVGYSWIDGHIFLFGNPGIGWQVVWKRWVLVVVGCAASFIIMMIPPTSGRKAVRLRNAAIISELSSLYSLLMSTWITDFESEEQHGALKKRRRGLMPLSTSTFAFHEDSEAQHLGVKKKQSSIMPLSTSTFAIHEESESQRLTVKKKQSSLMPPSMSTFAINEKGVRTNPSSQANLSLSYPPSSQRRSKWMVEFRRRMIALAQQIQMLKAQTEMARWEGGIRGAWAYKEYRGLAEREGDMLTALAQLAGSLDRLDPEWKITLNQRSLILNPNFITEVMSTFTLVSQSLRTGEPMHQILPTTLLDRLLQEYTVKTLKNMQQPEERTEYVEKVQSPEFMYFATGIAAVSLIIGSLDDLHKATKRLCGEVPFAGFEQWRTEYQRAYGSF